MEQSIELTNHYKDTRAMLIPGVIAVALLLGYAFGAVLRLKRMPVAREVSVPVGIWLAMCGIGLIIYGMWLGGYAGQPYAMCGAVAMICGGAVVAYTEVMIVTWQQHKRAEGKTLS